MTTAPQARSSRWLGLAIAAAVAGALLWYREPLRTWWHGASEQVPRAKPATASSAHDEVDHYTCSMHPSVRRKSPGRCPICGMQLIAVTKRQATLGIVTIAPMRQQLIGVRTGPVVLAPLVRSVRAAGRLTYDESSLTDVTLKVRGYIVKLFASRMGQRVKKGEALFSFYSPELYAAEQELLLALHSPLPSSIGGAVAHLSPAVAAARQRLRLLDLRDDQIDAVEKNGRPLDEVTVRSPAAGVVIEKDVVQGSAVEAGMRVLRIAALSKIWIEADVYERDLSSVRVGQRARVQFESRPGEDTVAVISYLYPYVDPATRTGRVRLELDNKAFDLRPGTYASVLLDDDRGLRLQVPTSAVVYTGPRRLVFLDLGEGRFKPQEVQIGAESNGSYEVLAGLSQGDRVATSGVFLIAAEARISSAAKYWESPSAGAEVSPPQPTDGARSPAAQPAAVGSAARPGKSVQKPVIYVCLMHPEVRSPTPGRCPKCGMELVPMRKGTAP